MLHIKKSTNNVTSEPIVILGLRIDSAVLSILCKSTKSSIIEVLQISGSVGRNAADPFLDQKIYCPNLLYSSF